MPEPGHKVDNPLGPDHMEYNALKLGGKEDNKLGPGDKEDDVPEP